MSSGRGWSLLVGRILWVLQSLTNQLLLLSSIDSTLEVSAVTAVGHILVASAAYLELSFVGLHKVLSQNLQLMPCHLRLVQSLD